MEFEITNCSEKMKKDIRRFIGEDIFELISDLTHQSIYDLLIYGYNPWNYAEEFKLNFKYQKIK